MPLSPLINIHLGSDIQQCRMAPVRLGPDAEGLVVIYSQNADLDPGAIENFTDGLHLAVFDGQGKKLWGFDYGRGTIPGMWFSPVLCFDLDGDGIDKIYTILNPTAYIMRSKGLRLTAFNALDGSQLGDTEWPAIEQDCCDVGAQFRFFLMPAFANGEPRLITAQGTYREMKLQARDKTLKEIWSVDIGQDTPGARGSHRSPIVDLNNDGIDEILWGERCLSSLDGRQLFCADEQQVTGHSDIIQPVLNWNDNTWTFVTGRESPNGFPRLACYDSTGERVWGKFDDGHMDMGFVLHTREHGPIYFITQVGTKKAGTSGYFQRADLTEHSFALNDFDSIAPPCSITYALPIDMDGDGFHEIVCNHGEHAGKVMRWSGEVLGRFSDYAPTAASTGNVAMVCQWNNNPGEILGTWSPDGQLTLWHDPDAETSPRARQRYRHPFYQTNRRLSTSGYNMPNLGGI